MSITVHREFRIAGVLTDMTSVVFRDSANTYGVKQTVAGTSVVTKGTALTKTSTGVYDYTFDEPAYDLSYTIAIEYIYAGATNYETPEVVVGTSTPSSTYNAPGMTLAQIRTRIASYLTLTLSDSTTSDRVDEAITACGLAASTWKSTAWWWLYAKSSFPTVASTASYNLRTVNSSAMADFYAPRMLFWGTSHRLIMQPKLTYDKWYAGDTNTGTSYHYALDADGKTAYLFHTPSAVATITVAYKRRHSKIINGTSADSALIVPGEWHYPVYVGGAVWLLRHEVMDATTLHQCPAFVEAMKEMMANAPDEAYDLNSDERGGNNEPLDEPRETHYDGTVSM